MICYPLKLIVFGLLCVNLFCEEKCTIRRGTCWCCNVSHRFQPSTWSCCSRINNWGLFKHDFVSGFWNFHHSCPKSTHANLMWCAPMQRLILKRYNHTLVTLRHIKPRYEISKLETPNPELGTVEVNIRPVLYEFMLLQYPNEITPCSCTNRNILTQYLNSREPMTTTNVLNNTVAIDPQLIMLVKLFLSSTLSLAGISGLLMYACSLNFLSS